ncbi:phosphotransferase [Yoonia sp. GPGPB17]|uniref:phosphotransferase n=1 Tax=Yoonia sp. GPGPB17 TaxID=3026147 RepID=UPI0030C0802A
MEPIARNIIQTLQTQGLVSQRDLVDGSSVLFMGRQRNRFFVYKQLHGPSFFIKHAHEGEAGTVESVTLEAQIYKAVADNADFQHLQAVMPQLLHFDQDSATMTLLLIKDAEDLGTRARRLGQNSCDDAGQMGRIAAQYHILPQSAVDALAVDFPAKPHWIFRLEETPSPLPSLRGRSPASAALIDALRANPQIKHSLQWCRDNWVSDALIHGDFKLENFLTAPSEADPGHQTLRLIDWERADRGDPAWDVGCGFGAFVIHRVMQKSGDALGAALPEMRAFWTAYSASRSGCDSAFLDRCIAMMAARLLVAGYEYCFAQDDLPDLSLALMQLAETVISLEGQAEIAATLARPCKQAA